MDDSLVILFGISTLVIIVVLLILLYRQSVQRMLVIRLREEFNDYVRKREEAADAWQETLNQHHSDMRAVNDGLQTFAKTAAEIEGRVEKVGKTLLHHLRNHT